MWMASGAVGVRTGGLGLAGAGDALGVADAFGEGRGTLVTVSFFFETGVSAALAASFASEVPLALTVAFLAAGLLLAAGLASLVG